MNCQHCGIYNTNNSKYCRQCGKPLSVNNITSDTNTHSLVRERHSESAYEHTPAKSYTTTEKTIVIILVIVILAVVGFATFGVGLIPLGIAAKEVLKKYDIY